jgi:hypothetical protein
MTTATNMPSAHIVTDKEINVAGAQNVSRDVMKTAHLVAVNFLLKWLTKNYFIFELQEIIFQFNL